MPENQNDRATIVALDALFDQWNRSDQPGLLVGVQRGDRFVYRRSFGMASLESHRANSLSTRMRIGSTSKHFLGLLVLFMQAEGLLDLDAPIGAYLPELNSPNAEPTLRQLLQHRGGIRCHIDLGFIGHGMAAPPQGSALQMLQRQQGRSFQAGEAMIYNNGGYHLVSLAAARVGGASLASLLERYLFAPLGMDATGLAPSDYVVTPGIASFHLQRSGGWGRGLFPSNEILGEGGIVSTVDDMLKWAAFLQSGRAPSGARIGDALLDTSNERDGTQGYYGLGLSRRTYRGIHTIRHPGGVTGGSSELLCAPDHGVSIVILSNGAPDASPSVLADKVIDIVLGDVLNASSDTQASDEFRALLGSYGSNATGMVYGLEEIDGAPFVRIAHYPVPAPLERASQGGWSTGITGLSPVVVQRDDCDPKSLRIGFAGKPESYARLEEGRGAVMPAGVQGAFTSPESGLEATVERQDDGALLRIRDSWGVAEFDLTPIGGAWLAMVSRPSPNQFAATLWFPHGWNGGFTLNSARTRGLQFRKLDVLTEEKTRVCVQCASAE